jgi:hypothetical protein
MPSWGPTSATVAIRIARRPAGFPATPQLFLYFNQGFDPLGAVVPRHNRTLLPSVMRHGLPIARWTPDPIPVTLSAMGLQVLRASPAADGLAQLDAVLAGRAEVDAREHA